jgi:hypothetical protein
VIDDIGDCFFFDVEAAIADIFLPALYGETLKDCTYRPNLSALPLKFAGLALPDPTASSEGNYEASTLVCSHILAAFRGTESFSSTDHQSLRKAVTAEIKTRLSDKQDLTLSTILADLDSAIYSQNNSTWKGNRAMAKRHALYIQWH